MTRTRALVLAAVAVVALGGCTSPDTSPVPTQAAEPFVCDGVPLEGVELTLGGAPTVDTVEGRWGPDASFLCATSRGDAQVSVHRSVAAGLEDDAPNQPNAQEFDADAAGEGWTFGSGDSATALWHCDPMTTTVELREVSTEGRDATADARALLVSMLPWACGDEDAPPATS